jgi:hypothetical protein
LPSRGESDRVVYVAIMREDTSKLDEKLGDNNWGTWDAQFRGLAYRKGIIAMGVVPDTLITLAPGKDGALYAELVLNVSAHLLPLQGEYNSGRAEGDLSSPDSSAGY